MVLCNEKEAENVKRYEAVIFDLDGTLINSIDDLADSCNDMLVAYDLPIHEV